MTLLSNRKFSSSTPVKFYCFWVFDQGTSRKCINGGRGWPLPTFTKVPKYLNKVFWPLKHAARRESKYSTKSYMLECTYLRAQTFLSLSKLLTAFAPKRFCVVVGSVYLIGTFAHGSMASSCFSMPICENHFIVDLSPST